MPSLKTVSPIDGSVVCERPLAGAAEIASALKAARKAAPAWRNTPVAERCALMTRFVEAMEARKAAIAEELTKQMGRPIRYTPGEVGGLAERSRYMTGAAPAALADEKLEPKENFTRFIRHEPLGVVFVVAPWNYPYLTAVNAVVPALLAGNAVILKHSAQTPLVAERFAEGFRAAGLPAGVFQVLHLSHADTEAVIRAPEVDFVAFTGSVEGGHAVQKAASERFIGTGLELGGKDPAYVRADANLAHAVENLVDGAFFNSGQSCCGIERIYAHKDIYDKFVEGFVALTGQYKLGNPLDPETTLGPLRGMASVIVRGLSGLGAEMKRFRPGQVVEAELRERAAAA